MMSMAKSWIPITSSNINKDVAAAAAPNSNISNCRSSSESKALDVGLKILTNSKSKTTINHSKPIFQRNQIPSSTTSCYYYNNNNNNQIPAATCFLKSCFLCHNHLSPNKDIYMYRGDQGFCSEECRNRQIYMDDVEQLQIKIMQRQSQSQSQSRTTFNGRRLHCSNHRAPSSTLHTPSPPVFS